MFPASDKLARSRLQEGCFALALVVVPLSDGLGEAADVDGGAAPPPEQQHTAWYHIGFQSLSPWFTGFEGMTSAADIRADLVVLTASCEFFGEFDVLKRLMPDRENKGACDLRLYELLASSAIVGEFRPGTQEAKAVGEPNRFWQAEMSGTSGTSFFRGVVWG